MITHADINKRCLILSEIYLGRKGKWENHDARILEPEKNGFVVILVYGQAIELDAKKVKLID